MERKGVRALVLMFMVLSIAMQQTYAASTNSFAKCYQPCFMKCNYPYPSPIGCSVKCLAKCMFPSTLNNMHYYCSLGCASSKCTTISTQEYSGEEAVEACVNSCSYTCNKHQ
ncbi:hypothetical protein IFM89_012915 [Coptis chinensis]|uniref:Thionin-like protein 2 n=1 Tax=Coptis chinensis TaxID=261450 RepID=A0A835HB90_9MAGN|nr:hypothetical protein IFM89_012915 [Coptis chinensis]